jgi:hypothetical protein
LARPETHLQATAGSQRHFSLVKSLLWAQPGAEVKACHPVNVVENEWARRDRRRGELEAAAEALAAAIVDHAEAKAKEAAAAAALRERYELEASADAIEVVRRLRSHGPARLLAA